MKKKKILGKALCIMLAGTMVLSVTSCKKGGSTTKPGNSSGLVAEAADQSSSKEAVFRLDKEMDFPFTPSYTYIFGDKVVFFSSYYDDGSGYDYEDYAEPENEEMEEAPVEGGEEVAEPEGGVTEEAPADGGEDVAEPEEPASEGAGEGDEDVNVDDSSSGNEQTSKMGWIVADVNGNLGDVVVYTKNYPADQAFSVDSSTVTPDGNLSVVCSMFDYNNNRNNYHLLTLSLDGKELSDVELKLSDNENVDRVIICSDGTICAYVNNKLQLYDYNQKLISEIPADKVNGLMSFAVTKSGKYYIGYYDDSYTSQICEVNPTGKTLGEPISLPFLGGGANLNPAKDHDFYTRNDDGLVVVDINNNTAEAKTVFNFLDSDILAMNTRVAALIDDETAILVMDDDGGDSGIYKRVPPEQVKDKKIITLGSIYSASYDVQKRVLDYNKKSDSYRIRLVNYEQYMTSDDMMACEKQFRNDILSKNGPDIIMTYGMYDPGVYASKGVFADMYPYLEKNGINKEDYLENVFEAGSLDGKLYIIMPQISIEGIAVKKSMLNGKSGFTMQEFIDLEQQHNCVGKGIAGVKRDDLLKTVLACNASSFYDVNTGKCNFTSDDFINTLKWVKNYPVDDPNNQNYDYQEDMKNQEIALHNDTALATEAYFYNFRDFNEWEQVKFGDDIVLVGFPGAQDPASGVIMADMGFAISALGDNQDAAFDFVKYYLSDEFQMPEENSPSTWTIPISKKALDKKIEIETGKYFDYDYQTKKITYTDESAYSYAQAKDIILTPLSKEHAQVAKDFIYATHYCTSYDQKIIDIINEEAGPFFNDQKSAEDVANIIQSRVSIYVQENQ